MKINRSTGFVRVFKRYVRKLNARQMEEVYRRMRLFEQDWRDSELETHKLKNVGEKWAFTILRDSSRDDRAVFIFVKKEKEIWLINIGSHDVVYSKN